MTTEYDFEDPKIRDMVDRHEPREMIITAGDGTSRFAGIFCETCHAAWPCRPHLELKDWLRVNQV